MNPLLDQIRRGHVKHDVAEILRNPRSVAQIHTRGSSLIVDLVAERVLRFSDKEYEQLQCNFDNEMHLNRDMVHLIKFIEERRKLHCKVLPDAASSQKTCWNVATGLPPSGVIGESAIPYVPKPDEAACSIVDGEISLPLSQQQFLTLEHQLRRDRSIDKTVEDALNAIRPAALASDCHVKSNYISYYIDFLLYVNHRLNDDVKTENFRVNWSPEPPSDNAYSNAELDVTNSAGGDKLYLFRRFYRDELNILAKRADRESHRTQRINDSQTKMTQTEKAELLIERKQKRMLKIQQMYNQRIGGEDRHLNSDRNDNDELDEDKDEDEDNCFIDKDSDLAMRLPYELFPELRTHDYLNGRTLPFPEDVWKSPHFLATRFIQTCAAQHSQGGDHSLNLDSYDGILFVLLLEHTIMLKVLHHPLFQDLQIHAKPIPGREGPSQPGIIRGKGTRAHASIILRLDRESIHGSSSKNKNSKDIYESGEHEVVLSPFDVHSVLAYGFSQALHDIVCPITSAHTNEFTLIQNMYRSVTEPLENLQMPKQKHGPQSPSHAQNRENTQRQPKIISSSSLISSSTQPKMTQLITTVLEQKRRSMLARNKNNPSNVETGPWQANKESNDGESIVDHSDLASHSSVSLFHDQHGQQDSNCISPQVQSQQSFSKHGNLPRLSSSSPPSPSFSELTQLGSLDTHVQHPGFVEFPFDQSKRAQLMKDIEAGKVHLRHVNNIHDPKGDACPQHFIKTGRVKIQSATSHMSSSNYLNESTTTGKGISYTSQVIKDMSLANYPHPPPCNLDPQIYTKTGSQGLDSHSSISQERNQNSEFDEQGVTNEGKWVGRRSPYQMHPLIEAMSDLNTSLLTASAELEQAQQQPPSKPSIDLPTSTSSSSPSNHPQTPLFQSSEAPLQVTLLLPDEATSTKISDWEEWKSANKAFVPHPPNSKLVYESTLYGHHHLENSGNASVQSSQPCANSSSSSARSSSSQRNQYRKATRPLSARQTSTTRQDKKGDERASSRKQRPVSARVERRPTRPNLAMDWLHLSSSSSSSPKSIHIRTSSAPHANIQEDLLCRPALSRSQKIRQTIQARDEEQKKYEEKQKLLLDSKDNYNSDHHTGLRLGIKACPRSTGGIATIEDVPIARGWGGFGANIKPQEKHFKRLKTHNNGPACFKSRKQRQEKGRGRGLILPRRRVVSAFQSSVESKKGGGQLDKKRFQLEYSPIQVAGLSPAHPLIHNDDTPRGLSKEGIYSTLDNMHFHHKLAGRWDPQSEAAKLKKQTLDLISQEHNLIRDAYELAKRPLNIQAPPSRYSTHSSAIATVPSRIDSGESEDKGQKSDIDSNDHEQPDEDNHNDGDSTIPKKSIGQNKFVHDSDSIDPRLLAHAKQTKSKQELDWNDDDHEIYKLIDLRLLGRHEEATESQDEVDIDSTIDFIDPRLHQKNEKKNFSISDEQTIGEANDDEANCDPVQTLEPVPEEGEEIHKDETNHENADTKAQSQDQTETKPEDMRNNQQNVVGPNRVNTVEKKAIRSRTQSSGYDYCTDTQVHQGRIAIWNKHTASSRSQRSNFIRTSIRTQKTADKAFNQLLKSLEDIRLRSTRRVRKRNHKNSSSSSSVTRHTTSSFTKHAHTNAVMSVERRPLARFETDTSQSIMTQQKYILQTRDGKTVTYRSSKNHDTGHPIRRTNTNKTGKRIQKAKKRREYQISPKKTRKHQSSADWKFKSLPIPGLTRLGNAAHRSRSTRYRRNETSQRKRAAQTERMKQRSQEKHQAEIERHMAISVTVLPIDQQNRESREFLLSNYRASPFPPSAPPSSQTGRTGRTGDASINIFQHSIDAMTEISYRLNTTHTGGTINDKRLFVNENGRQQG